MLARMTKRGPGGSTTAAEEKMRCAECDGDNILPDYLERLRCRTCDSLERYKVDKPATGSPPAPLNDETDDPRLGLGRSRV